MKYINILYTGYRINNSPQPPPPPPPHPALSKSTINYCNSIRVLVFIFHVMFDDSIVYNSCTHISRGVNIILPNLYFCTVNI